MSALTPSERWHGPIVVGVDGSEGTIRAVRWAAAEAVRRKLPLRLVHAHLLPTFGYLPMLETRSMHEELIDLAHDWLRSAAAAAAKVSPTIDVHTELRTAGPVPLLIEESLHARLIVVGSHGLGGIPRMLLGSTSEGLAGRAHCPLVVVPSGLDDPAPDAPVVVGVDGSPVSDAAVAVAFDEASTRNVGLVAVHAWSDQPITNPFVLRLTDDDWAQIEDAERRSMAEQLAGWRDKYPDVTVRRVLVRDRPATSLLGNASTAQLLVVGSRGRGGFASALLGSTSRAVLHHAPCPVIVAGPNRDR
jgi:nucleotide-binding universal stress UspA family protein